MLCRLIREQIMMLSRQGCHPMVWPQQFERQVMTSKCLENNMLLSL